MFFILFFISSKMSTMLPSQKNFIVVKFHFHNFLFLIRLKCTETAAWRKTNRVLCDSSIKQFFLNLKSWLNKDAIQIQCTVIIGASISRKQRAVLNCYVLFFQLVFVLRKCKKRCVSHRELFSWGPLSPSSELGHSQSGATAGSFVSQTGPENGQNITIEISQ